MLLSSCGGTSVTHPGGGTSDTYLRATITLQDIGSPCTPLNCPPDYYDCLSRSPLYAGQTWTVHSDTAVAGREGAGAIQFRLSGTDNSGKTTVALELKFTQAPVTQANVAPIDVSTDINQTLVDVNAECNQINNNGVPESRFRLVPGSGSVTITAADYSGPNGGYVFALPDSSGGFTPASILEGTFSFDANGLQATPSGTIGPIVHVTGCFRLNIPDSPQGVPVDPDSAVAACP